MTRRHASLPATHTYIWSRSRFGFVEAVQFDWGSDAPTRLG
jgi:hypothetical protein